MKEKYELQQPYPDVIASTLYTCVHIIPDIITHTVL